MGPNSVCVSPTQAPFCQHKKVVIGWKIQVCICVRVCVCVCVCWSGKGKLSLRVYGEKGAEPLSCLAGSKLGQYQILQSTPYPLPFCSSFLRNIFLLQSASLPTLPQLQVRCRRKVSGVCLCVCVCVSVCVFCYLRFLEHAPRTSQTDFLLENDWTWPVVLTVCSNWKNTSRGL